MGGGGGGWLPGSIVRGAFIGFVPKRRRRVSKRPFRRGVRGSAVHRHLPCAPRRKTGGVRRPEPDRQDQEKLKGEVMLSRQQLRIAALSTADIPFAALIGN